MPYPREIRERNHKICIEVYELYATGLGCVRIHREVGVVSLATVSAWLHRPERYHPFIDEVAIMRALEGDRHVFDALTIWERDVFYDALQAKRMSMDINAWIEWVQLYAGRLGFPDGGNVGDRLHCRYGAGFLGRPEKRMPARNGKGQITVRRKDRYGRRNFI